MTRAVARLIEAWGLVFREESGGVATMAAFVLPLTLVLMGGAVDFDLYVRAGQGAQSAGDAVALATARRVASQTDEEPEDDTALASEAEAIGRANVPDDLDYITFTTTIDRAAGTVTVHSKGAFKTAFLRLLKMDTIPIDKMSVATIPSKGYVNFYFLIDVSESMNIAASEADRLKLEEVSAYYTRTNDPSKERACAFACHQVETYWHPTMSVYDMNETLGSDKARLRIDVLRDAVDEAVDEILAQTRADLTINIATAGFSSAFQEGVEPTTDASAIKASIRNFDNSNPFTIYDDVMPDFDTFVGAQGTGDEPTSPTKIAVLITDGVNNVYNGSWDPIDRATCNTLKDRGVSLAVLEIKYLERYDFQNYFLDRVASIYDDISPSLKDCASTGLHFLASDADDAAKALEELIEMLFSQNLRLTQ